MRNRPVKRIAVWEGGGGENDGERRSYAGWLGWGSAAEGGVAG